MDVPELGGRPSAGLIFGRAEVWRTLQQVSQQPHARMLMMFTTPRNLEHDPEVSLPLTHIGERLALFETSVFSVAGMAGWLPQNEASGVVSRVSGHLPLQMIVFDDELAVVSLTTGEEGTAVVVRGRSECLPLVELFEGIWRDAQPLSVASKHQLSEAERVLMGLLAAGHTDVAAARVMGISDRSVRRHVRAAMAKLGVTSRTQLGLRLGSLNLVPHRQGI